MTEQDPKERELRESQLERLAFIDFRAYFLGEIRRSDITERFGVATAAATRDLAAYRERGGRITMDPGSKAYWPDPDFRPIFGHSAERALTTICQGSGEGSSPQHRSLVPCASPHQLNSPDVETIAAVSRAIHRKQVLHIHYHSFSSGHTERQIVPFALANTGERWHVRAFDRRRRRFTDFVLTRIGKPTLLPNEKILDEEQGVHDIQWTRIVQLEIVPHPGRTFPEIVAMDYGMKDGRLIVNVRASLAGYFLRQWNVDCSPDHSGGPDRSTNGSNDAVRLWLNNTLALYGVETASLAPGYRPPESS